MAKKKAAKKKSTSKTKAKDKNADAKGKPAAKKKSAARKKSTAKKPKSVAKTPALTVKESPCDEEVRAVAYFVYEERLASGTPGSQDGDWHEALRRLTA